MKRGNDARLIYGPKNLGIKGEYNEEGFKLTVEKIEGDYVVFSYEYIKEEDSF